MFRYLPFLPISPESARPHLRVGWSPLYKPLGLGKSVGMSQLYIKDDGQNPTASLKDRASIIAVIKAVEEKAPTVACSSTGNAASSLAGNAARHGFKECYLCTESCAAREDRSITDLWSDGDQCSGVLRRDL